MQKHGGLAVWVATLLVVELVNGRHLETSHLRNIALTAPYMHDGSEATLADVILFYDKGGNPNPWLDGGMRPLGLTEQEKADLLALLESFTSLDLARFDDLSKLMPKQ